GQLDLLATELVNIAACELSARSDRDRAVGNDKPPELDGEARGVPDARDHNPAHRHGHREHRDPKREPKGIGDRYAGEHGHEHPQEYAAGHLRGHAFGVAPLVDDDQPAWLGLALAIGVARDRLAALVPYAHAGGDRTRERVRL